MEDPESRRKRFIVYTSEDPVENPGKMRRLLDELISLGLPERARDRAESTLESFGITEESLAPSVTPRSVSQRRAGGMAAIAALVGVAVLMLERRRSSSLPAEDLQTD